MAEDIPFTGDMFNTYRTAARQLWIKTKIFTRVFIKNDPGQQRAGATTIKKYRGIISNKMLIGLTLSYTK